MRQVANRLAVGVLMLGGLLTACSDDRTEQTAIDTDDGGSGPVILGVSPRTLHVGDEITVTAQDLQASETGRTYLRITGYYFDDAGEQHAFDRKVAPALSGDTLTWRVWPDVVFHPQGNRIGYFFGTVRIVQEGQDQSRQVSEGYPVQFYVAPSLVLRALRATRDSLLGLSEPCGDMIVPATVEGVPLAVAVEAVGLVPGSAEAPVEFSWRLPPDGVRVRSDGWDAFYAPQELKREASITVTDRAADGTLLSALVGDSVCDGPIPSEPAWWAELVRRTCGDDASSKRQYLFRLAGWPAAVSDDLDELVAAPPPEGSGLQQATISVEAIDARGTQARLSVPLDVYRRYSFDRDASLDRIAEREPVVMAADPIPPTDVPTEARFYENQTEQRPIEMGMSVSPATRGSVGLIYALDSILGVHDPRDLTRNSSQYVRDISQSVPPGMCATFYRQAEKVRRVARVTRRGACGEQVDDGEVFIDDWQWSREIAIALECPAPSTELKPAGPCEKDCDAIKRTLPGLSPFGN